MVITRVIIGSHIPVGLPDAEVGNIFQVRLNKMITNIAAKKPGKEPETNERTLIRPSSHLFFQTAAIIPKGMEIRIVKPTEIHASKSVFGKYDNISCATGLCV